MTEHLADFVAVLGLLANEVSCELFKRDVVAGKFDEIFIESQRLELEVEAFFQDRVHVVLIGFFDRSGNDRVVAAQRGDLLADDDRVALAFGGAVTEPFLNGDAVVSHDHEGVVQVADDAAHFRLKDLVEASHRFFGGRGGSCWNLGVRRLTAGMG